MAMYIDVAYDEPGLYTILNLCRNGDDGKYAIHKDILNPVFIWSPLAGSPPEMHPIWTSGICHTAVPRKLAPVWVCTSEYRKIEKKISADGHGQPAAHQIPHPASQKPHPPTSIRIFTSKSGGNSDCIGIL
ncbi:hypothetical protein PGT21_029868, partial [Puccinia graminis f. sp. tritici]